MAFTSAGFPSELVRDVFVNAQGHSSLAKLSRQEPLAFSGTDIMVAKVTQTISAFERSLNLKREAMSPVKSVRPTTARMAGMGIADSGIIQASRTTTAE